jgi:hypothetical protein
MAMSRLALPILVATAPLPSTKDSQLFRPAYAASAHGGKSKKAARDFDYAVSDCQGAGTPDSIQLEVSESAIEFHQILNMNCIAATRPSTVKLSYVKKGRDLEVSIILRSDVLSDCTCPIGIEGRIANLGKGAHRISFVFDHPDAANENPTRHALATKEFSIE